MGKFSLPSKAGTSQRPQAQAGNFSPMPICRLSRAAGLSFTFLQVAALLKANPESYPWSIVRGQVTGALSSLRYPHCLFSSKPAGAGSMEPSHNFAEAAIATPLRQAASPSADWPAPCARPAQTAHRRACRSPNMRRKFRVTSPFTGSC